MALDVTDLKEIQDRLTGALEESQTLLPEVHHRVKNNLQVVWSLVQLEAMQINHPAARARMEIIGQRINVMGRIHEQIYAHKEFSRIDFTLQLRALSERLTGACGEPKEIRTGGDGRAAVLFARHRHSFGPDRQRAYLERCRARFSGGYFPGG